MTAPVDVVTHFLRTFSTNDPDAIADYVAEGFHNEYLSTLGSGCTGRDEYRRRLPHFLAAFADRAYGIDDIVEQRRDAVTDVVVRYRFTATYAGDAIEMPGMMWFTVRGPHITRRVDSWDSLTFLQQIGKLGPIDFD